MLLEAYRRFHRRHTLYVFGAAEHRRIQAKGPNYSKQLDLKAHEPCLRKATSWQTARAHDNNPTRNHCHTLHPKSPQNAYISY
jgi:hypothetical protein